MTTQLPVSELILDYDIYPRHQIDSSNVTSIRRAVEAGVELPPIVADAKSKRVVDGFHRVTLYKRRGETTLVSVDLIDYPDEQAIFLDAIERNSAHGERLQRFDQARCALLAQQLSIDPDRVAEALHLTPKRLGELVTSKTAYDKDGTAFPITATVRHLAGSKFSHKREQAARRTGGMSIRFYAEQVANAVAGDLLPDDEGTLKALAQLHSVLDRLMKKAS